MAGKNQLLVAAIDFGTTYSGSAFSFRHEYEKDRVDIHASMTWSSNTGLISWKTPTTVLLDQNKVFHSFGYEAEDHYSDLMDRGEEKDWYYFHQFKMLLHNKKLELSSVILDGTPDPIFVYKWLRLNIGTGRIKHNPARIGLNVIALETLFTFYISEVTTIPKANDSKMLENFLSVQRKGFLVYSGYIERHLSRKSQKNETVLNRDVTIPDIHGREMPARKIFSLSIEYLKNNLMESLGKRDLDISLDDILWVLTVPAIWNEPAKQFMREAAEMAGIARDHLILALEPEAASLYCKYLQTEKIKTGEKVEVVPFQPGTIYMVLDLGGGTVDVTVHRVIDKDTLMELHKASGGAWGGTKVDEAYMNIVEEIYGSETVNEFKRNYRPDLLDLQRDFEVGKRKEVTKTLNIRFPAMLHSLFEERQGIARGEALERSRFSSKIKFRRDKISIEPDLFESLFDHCKDSIIRHVTDILKEPTVQGVSAIIMVGGFSEANIITRAVKEAFPQFRIIVPKEAGLAVVKGAVLYGHNPLTIASRICKSTYGVAVRAPFIPGYHPENKKTKIGEEEFCNDAFSSFVRKGESVKAGEKLIKTYDVMVQRAPVTIQVFASTEKNPILTTEPSCNLLGKIIVKQPDGGWPKDAQVQVEMGFGGTEFTVSARDAIKPNQIYQTSFDFLGEGNEQVIYDITNKLEQTYVN